jgi:hypothetical protein
VSPAGPSCAQSWALRLPGDEGQVPLHPLTPRPSRSAATPPDSP